MPKPKKIGDLRHRITIETLTNASDGQGGQLRTWSTHKELWASVEAASAKERYFSEQTQHTVTHKVWVRFTPGVLAKMRVNFKGAILQIHGVRDPDGRKFWLELDCEEGVGS